METISILIVDDEPAQREILAGYLRKKRHTVVLAGSAVKALEALKKNSIDIVLTDFKMPDKTGFELLKDITSLYPHTTVILMTAFGTIEGAVSAMREGAYDYLGKPIDLDELDLLLQRILERNRLISENRLLKEQLAEKFSFVWIVSQSPEMDVVLDTARRVASSNASVLIIGESGTGKELIAKAIHFSSERKDKPFIAVNCAALNENLLESELFGHEKGAFTGADRQRRGRFEMANGGTIFLDEIGDIPLSTQAKLLRVLQEHQLERVGGNETIVVDVRVIAATNRNLEEAIRAGIFREDLFYRLNVVGIEIPPLRERRQDIVPLLDFFLTMYAKENKRKKLVFSKEARDILLRYEYPGNVREMQNILQRAVILSRKEIITTADLPAVLKRTQSETELTTGEKQQSLTDQVERLEKEMVFEALRVHNGNQSKAAKQLDISERNLRYRLHKWGVK
jgi:two-component system NtrC family response regulator